PVVGADCVLRDSPAQVRRRAVVARDWSSRRGRTANQVFDRLLYCGRFGRNVAHQRAAFFSEPLVLGGSCVGGCNLSAECHLAVPAWPGLVSLLAAHSCP